MNRTCQRAPASCPAVSAARRTAVCLRLVLLLVTALLVSYGCAPKAVPVAPRTALSLKPSAPVDGSARTVQGTPEYRQAVRFFAHRDYRQALSLVDRLLAEPQFAQDPSGSGFLRSQQAICRRAVSPQAPNSLTLNQTHPASPPAVAEAPAAASLPTAASLPLADCGPRALLRACQTLDRPATLEGLRRQAGTTAAGTSLAGLARAATSLGLKVRGVQMDKRALTQLSGPAVAWVDGNHYVALLSIDGEQATIHDPNKQGEEVLPVNTLLQRSGGVLLTLSR